MAVVSAFLVPGSPLPYVKRDNPPWGKIATGLERAGAALVQSKPDVILLIFNAVDRRPGPTVADPPAGERSAR